ncbi:hypothetical protein [Burkholderia sp. IDO3]|uniref:hypothetical protein n=1 Tax=Burkholderia sp. IDO3 TaxID=1705310 RepID=UPI000BBA6076|nr:hypothetical protein [Burkholderia sp. IDO3]AXK68053.1 hypothetical protein DCN14_36105 [Burkholderia sp. IDO3]PCD57981.1 hypothetical protein CN645_31045 [Burkholderia sp. IDO3]
MSYQTTAQAPTNEEIEAFARAREPHVWALDPPDFSSAQYRRASMEHAEDVLLEQRGLPPVRTYE